MCERNENDDAEQTGRGVMRLEICAGVASSKMATWNRVAELDLAEAANIRPHADSACLSWFGCG